MNMMNMNWIARNVSLADCPLNIRLSVEIMTLLYIMMLSNKVVQWTLF